LDAWIAKAREIERKRKKTQQEKKRFSQRALASIGRKIAGKLVSRISL